MFIIIITALVECINQIDQSKMTDEKCVDLTQKSVSISLSNPVRRSSSISATSESFAKTHPKNSLGQLVL